MDKLYVITGASSGIGRSIALYLAETGQNVLACGRNPAKLKELQTLSKRIHVFAGDLSSGEGCTSLIAHAQSLEMPIIGLINNAGVYEPGSFLDTTDDTWTTQFETNLLSAVRVTRGLFESLKESSPSSVLNISSTLGRRPVAGTSSYSAIKAAMINWTQCLALEWARYNIRVNCICPGLVDTPIHKFHGKDDTAPERVSAHQMQPLGRMGTPDEIAWAAEFLLSERSAWTTGSVLAVDGGIGL